jgi:tRNA (guanine-N7-)-methyltransferase
LALLARKTTEGGQLHIATDWENYAEHCSEILTDDAHWKNSCSVDADNFPFLPVGQCYQLRAETKYERRGLRLGHRIFDLVFVRR